PKQQGKAQDFLMKDTNQALEVGPESLPLGIRHAAQRIASHDGVAISVRDELVPSSEHLRPEYHEASVEGIQAALRFLVISRAVAVEQETDCVVVVPAGVAWRVSNLANLEDHTLVEYRPSQSASRIPVSPKNLRHPKGVPPFSSAVRRI